MPHLRAQSPASHPLRLAVPLAISALVLSQYCVCALAAFNQPPTRDQIIQAIDAAVYKRLNGIPRYTAQEQYKLYRNGSSAPAAQETIEVTYIRGSGKDYKPISQIGSPLLRSAVIDKILAGEKDANLPVNREAALLTSRNYDLRPRPGTVQRNGVTCILVDIYPRRKGPHLFTGKVWLDASDYAIVRLEGAPSQPPSFLAGQTTVSRDYARVNGYAMATHAEAHSHSFLFGITVITIDYTGYNLELDPQPLAASH